MNAKFDRKFQTKHQETYNSRRLAFKLYEQNNYDVWLFEDSYAIPYTSWPVLKRL